MSLPLCSCTPVARISLKVCTFSRIFCSKVSSHALGFPGLGAKSLFRFTRICLELRLGAVALTSCFLKYCHLSSRRPWKYFGWTGLLGRKSSLVRPQKRKYSISALGTLDQVEAIALLRAFDPGAWVRIAFGVKNSCLKAKR